MDGGCEPNTVCAPTGALEKTSRGTRSTWLRNINGDLTSFHMELLEGKRCSPESTFLENAGFI